MLKVFIWFQTECEVPVSSRRSASPHWHSLLIVWRPVYICPELSWAGSTDPTGRPTGEVDSSFKISGQPIYRHGWYIGWYLEFLIIGIGWLSFFIFCLANVSETFLAALGTPVPEHTALLLSIFISLQSLFYSSV